MARLHAGNTSPKATGSRLWHLWPAEQVESGCCHDPGYFAQPQHLDVPFQRPRKVAAVNSTKKGDEFERKVFLYFRSLIEQDQFLAKRECCRIYQKKKYYSRDRESDIIFDISIEITMPGREDPSIVYLIECKDTAHPVGIEDVEEFYSKAQQVCCGKPVMVSTEGFRERVVIFSRSKKIGLARYFGRGKLKWELDRSPSVFWLAPSEQAIPLGQLVDPDASSNYDFCGIYASSITNSIVDLFRSMAADVSEVFVSSPNFSPRVDPARGGCRGGGKSAVRW